jgi:hypothetical protein
MFAIKFIHLNISRIHSEEVLARYGEFFKEFKVSASRILSGYYVIFFIRRLILAISINLLKEIPFVQVLIISIFCWIVVLYLIIYRPYHNKTINVIQIIVEVCVATAYTVPICIIKGYLQQGLAGLIIYASINISYIVQLLPILLNAFQKLRAKIRCMKKKPDIVPVSVKNQTGVNFTPNPLTGSDSMVGMESTPISSISLSEISLPKEK